MAWVWIDDQMPDHKRIAAVSLAALGAFVAGLCYCSRMRTDGFIPGRKAAELAGSGKVRSELETAELWLGTKGGYHVRDYLDYQPSASELEQQSVSNRERQRRWRLAKRNGVTNDDVTPLEDTGVTGTPTPTKKDQDHGAVAPPECGKRVENPKLLIRLLASELDERPELFDEGESGILAHMKDVAAKAHILYDSPALGAALDKVLAARQRKGLRVSA